MTSTQTICWGQESLPRRTRRTTGQDEYATSRNAKTSVMPRNGHVGRHAARVMLECGIRCAPSFFSVALRDSQPFSVLKSCLLAVAVKPLAVSDNQRNEGANLTPPDWTASPGQNRPDPAQDDPSHRVPRFCLGAAQMRQQNDILQRHVSGLSRGSPM